MVTKTRERVKGNPRADLQCEDEESNYAMRYVIIGSEDLKWAAR
jgi:hypothetical protein